LDGKHQSSSIVASTSSVICPRNIDKVNVAMF
jgi:hypothetical protein